MPELRAVLRVQRMRRSLQTERDRPCMGERTVELEVGSVVLTPGFEEFDASRKGEFGCGRYPNVVTSVQFERMLSAAGPFEGHVVRLSDRREAKKVAWIQCVGSRDSQCGNEYCSSICCMASTKQAMVAQDHTPGLEATIFYMDIRAHGKDFDQYYERAKNQNGVRYIKSMPSRIVQMPGTMNPRVRFVGRDGQALRGGVRSRRAGGRPGAFALRRGMRRHGSGSSSTSTASARPIAFVAVVHVAAGRVCRRGVPGAERHPRDGDAGQRRRVDGDGAAGLGPQYADGQEEVPGRARCHRRRAANRRVHLPLRPEHRLGRRCRGVVKNIEHEPGVVFATHTMFTCADTSLSNIRNMIVEHRLNRIVVASCTPRTHEPLFRETMREAGLNPYLFEMANIRDQCSWVHSAVAGERHAKGDELVKMAIARAHRLTPLEGGTLDRRSERAGHRRRPERHDGGPGSGQPGLQGPS